MAEQVSFINNRLAYQEKNEDCELKNYLSNNPSSVLTDNLNMTRVNTKITHRKDALDLIDKLISNHINTIKPKAEALAENISKKSKAVAEINKIWGKLMTNKLSQVDPTDIDNKTYLTLSVEDTKLYNEIKKLIVKDLGRDKGMEEILPLVPMEGHEHDQLIERVNYDQLQAINANITAFSDTIQVDLDSEQQEFKNIMTQLTSAQEEIRDLRRAITAFSSR